MKKFMLFALALLAAACEKPVINEDLVATKNANVILHFVQYEQCSFGDDVTSLPYRGGAGVGSVLSLRA